MHVDLRKQEGTVATVRLDDLGVARASNAENQAFLDSFTVVERSEAGVEVVGPEAGERYLRALPANLRGSYFWAVLVED